MDDLDFIVGALVVGQDADITVHDKNGGSLAGYTVSEVTYHPPKGNSIPWDSKATTLSGETSASTAIITVKPQLPPPSFFDRLWMAIKFLFQIGESRSKDEGMKDDPPQSGTITGTLNQPENGIGVERGRPKRGSAEKVQIFEGIKLNP